MTNKSDKTALADTANKAYVVKGAIMIDEIVLTDEAIDSTEVGKRNRVDAANEAVEVDEADEAKAAKATDANDTSKAKDANISNKEEANKTEAAETANANGASVRRRVPVHQLAYR